MAMLAQTEPQSLRDLDLFADMSDADIDEILNACQQVEVVAGEMIYDAGQEQRSLYILLEGAVQVDLEIPKVGERLIVDLTPKDVFGEMSFFHPSPHSATVKCAANAQLLRLDRANYDLLLASGSRAAARLAVNAAGLLAARLAATDHWVAQVLEEQQSARIRNKWREFRAGMSSAFRNPRGVIGISGRW
jgi:CRP/FNR family transcriptional regulator, cyclic AMP receptor protein